MRTLAATLTLFSGLMLAGGCQQLKNDSDAVSGAGSVGLTQRMQEVLDEHASLGPKPIETLSPAEARQQPSLADAAKKWLRKHAGSDAPEEVGRIENRTFTSPGGRELAVRIYYPKGASASGSASAGSLRPMAVYWRGGGWVIADLDTYDASCRALCNAGNCIIVSADYRRAPESPFPAAADDAMAAYRWTLQNARSIGGDAKRIAVIGESAGGNLAAIVALSASENGLQPPTRQILIYPVTNYGFDTPSHRQHANAKPLNLTMMRWFWEHYLPNPAAGADWRASPLRAPQAMLAKSPPAIIINADVDPIRSDGGLYANRLRDAGVRVQTRNYERVTHEFFGMSAILPEAKDAVEFAAQGLK